MSEPTHGTYNYNENEQYILRKNSQNSTLNRIWNTN